MNKDKKISNGTRKGIIFVLIIVFAIFVGTRTVSAFSFFGGFFGGRIISDKAMEIELKEWAGYTCVVLGTSITINPIGSPPGTPTSYFIPWSITSRNGYPPISGRLIMGIYGGKTNIVCIYPSVPPFIETVSLDTIDLFGTSRW